MIVLLSATLQAILDALPACRKQARGAHGSTTRSACARRYANYPRENSTTPNNMVSEIASLYAMGVENMCPIFEQVL